MMLSSSVRNFAVLAGAVFVLMGFGACATSRFFCLECDFYGCHCKLGREAAAISELRTIHNFQAQYQEKHGGFGTLKELADTGLLSERFTNGQPFAGYVFADFEVSAETYSVSATRIRHSYWFGLFPHNSAYRDFVICEDGVIRSHESKTIRKLQRGEGQPISESPAPSP